MKVRSKQKEKQVFASRRTSKGLNSAERESVAKGGASDDLTTVTQVLLSVKCNDGEDELAVLKSKSTGRSCIIIHM